MKKGTKKNVKKNRRYNGYNVYGERCEVKTVKLDREKALEQCLDVLEKVNIAQAEGRRLEYTLDWTGLKNEEVVRVEQELDKIVRLQNFFVCNCRVCY